MMNCTKPYRYQLPRKAIKTDCPQCGHKHRKTLSRYVDTQTGEELAEQYGRCDRESNCGYFLSPYDKTATGQSYADLIYQQMRPNNSTLTRQALNSRLTRKSEPPVVTYSIPNEVFNQSLRHYERNQFALLLDQQFGQSVARDLLQRFQIGTSSHWPGACVFWYIDEHNHKRGGQIKLFGSDWHTEKYTSREGKKFSKTSWVHSALKRHLEKLEKPVPSWLIEYEEKAERSPCLFGLPQLFKAPLDKPVAIVEAPKTAVICTHYISSFIWLAVGSKSYLNPERLAPLHSHKIMLYPDLNAFNDWNQRAEQLLANGFQVEVSDYLENNAYKGHKQAGLDLADYLLQLPPTVSRLVEKIDRPGSILKPDESQLERLVVSPCNTYPAEWD